MSCAFKLYTKTKKKKKDSIENVKALEYHH